MLRSVKPELTTLEHQITLEAPGEGFVFYDDLLANSSDEERFPTADGDDVTIIMFTAGTTGTPKGVMLSHNSFTSYILAQRGAGRHGYGGEEHPHRAAPSHSRSAGGHGPPSTEVAPWCCNVSLTKRGG